jgi:hypothetical protein
MSKYNPPKAERVGDVIFCDKLPYPTDYVKQRISAIVFVPNDPKCIEAAREAILYLIKHGRLTDALVRLRVPAPDEVYDFTGMVQGVMADVAKNAPTPSIIT